MKIILKADYTGDDLRGDLVKLDQIHAGLIEKTGVRLDGPYLPQDASVLFIFDVESFEKFNQFGRMWFVEAQKENLPFQPLRYEICITPQEFYG